MDYEFSVDVAAIPERIWAVMIDVERWPEWTPSMTRIERLDGGAFAVGSTARVKQPRLPPNVWRVTGLGPGRWFTWATAGRGVTTEATHRLTPAADGGTRVTLTIRMTGPLAVVVGLFGWPLVRRYVRTEANGLKRRCEEGSNGT